MAWLNESNMIKQMNGPNRAQQMNMSNMPQQMTGPNRPGLNTIINYISEALNPEP